MTGQGRPVLVTPRIRLEPMTIDHLPLLVELDADAEVMRHLTGRARSPEEVHEHWGPVCRDVGADTVGLGWWIGRRSVDGEFLGWWDLSPGRPVPPVPTAAEAGWRLVRRHWHQGYATEGAAALLEHGFRTVGLSEVWAETMAVNVASRRVMERLGMRHVRTDHRSWEEPLPGAEQGEVVYRLRRAEWPGQDGHVATSRQEREQLQALAWVHERFTALAIDYWLFGGWAVDFHAGRVTRAHDDIDLAVWQQDRERVEDLLLADGWVARPEPEADGYTAYGRGEVRIEVALLARDGAGEGEGAVYTPLVHGRGDWPAGSFADDVAELDGVRARLVSRASLVEDKSGPREDAAAAAKDHADVLALTSPLTSTQTTTDRSAG